MESSIRCFYEVASNLPSFLFLSHHSVLLPILRSYLGVTLACYLREVLCATVRTVQRKLLVRTQRPESLFFYVFQNIERGPGLSAV